MRETKVRFTLSGSWRAFRADVHANPRDPRAWFVLFGLRSCQAIMGRPRRPRAISIPAIILYRVVTEFILSMELRPSTVVGDGLTLYHGFGLVVNDHAYIGSGVKLRNGVVIGNKVAGGECPVIGDNVEVGANAIIIGGISIGDGAIVGAGAVVVQSVLAGQVVAGNPARPIGNV